MSTPTVTRRAALLGAIVSSAAIAVPLSALAVAAPPKVPGELTDMLDRYEQTSIALIEVEKACRKMEDEFRDRLTRANLRVRMNGKRGLPDYRRVDHNVWPIAVRTEINEQFSARLCSALRREAEKDPMRRVLPSSVELRAEWAEVKKAAKPIFDRFNRVKRLVGWERAQDVVSDAYSARSEARRAMFAYRPQSLAEIHAIGAALYRTAKATGQWYEASPEFYQMLAGVEVSA